MVVLRCWCVLVCGGVWLVCVSDTVCVCVCVRACVGGTRGMGAPDTGSAASGGPVSPSGSVESLPGVPNHSGARIWVRQAMWHETCTHGDWLVALLNWVDNARDLFYLDERCRALQDVMAGALLIASGPSRQ